MAAPTPERWDAIRALFHEAVERDEPDRSAWLAAACPDPVMRAEVERLLRLAESAGSFLETPACRIDPPETGAPGLADGEIVAGRFRIVRLLGRGGMGEVYEAYDDLLKEAVALKCVRSDAVQIDALAARLRREVQLGRRISHRGICRLHDVAIHASGRGSALVVTMELLHGETLASRLERGPLPLSSAIDLARQLAAALDAAHAEGILHRDIKPGNIFIEGEASHALRAVITDFGLARPTDGSGSSESVMTGALMGTPEYMAPEQRAGETSPASDRYALALVVREMLTGLRPSRHGAMAPRLSKVQEAAFAHALRERPDQRPASAAGMVAAIAEAWTPTRRRLRVWVPAAAVVMALVVVAAWVAPGSPWSRYWQRASPAVSPASQVFLTDMLNGTLDPELDGAGEMLRSQLAQSPHFELLAPDRSAALLAQMRRPATARLEPDVAREVAMRAGVPLVIFTTLTRLGEDYGVNVKVERVGSRPGTVSGTWTAVFNARGKREVPEAIHDASGWLRRLAGESASELADQDRPPADTTTSSWDALRLYTRAQAREASGRVDEAALLFDEAIRVDPDFAMAHMRLADTLISLKRERDGYAAWAKAIQLIEHRQITSRESLRIRGQYFEDTGDLRAAEQAYRAYALHYPNDFFASFFLGSVLVDLGRGGEAVTWFERAVAVRPGWLAGRVHLARTLLDTGQIEAARRQIAEVRRSGEGDWATWLDGLARFAAADVSGGLATIQPLASSADPQWRSRAFTLQAAWLSETGDERAALQAIDRGLAFDQANGVRDRETDKWLFRAELQRRLGDRDGCLGSVERALALGPGVRRLALAGGILARAGDLRRARALLPRFDDQPPLPRVVAAKNRLAGEIDLAAGEARRAMVSLDAGLAAAPQREGRLSLATALVLSGEVARARLIVDDVAQHPIRLYVGPEPELPGMWAAALFERARLLEGVDRAAAAEAWAAYRRVHVHETVRP